ncbi:hypothetical protein Tco_1242059, partial [Tanacetum coccineum]
MTSRGRSEAIFHPSDYPSGNLGSNLSH